MTVRAVRRTALVAVCLPLIVEIYLLATGRAGADPGKQAVHFLGQTSVWLILMVLMVPVTRVLTGWLWPVRVRRIIGVAAFCYGVVHLAAYTVFLLGLEFDQLGAEIVERPYITVGMLALALMLPLAVTSTDTMVRRLGRDWKRLHRLIYPIAVMAVIHVWWQARSDLGFALLLSGLLSLLLLVRLYPVKRFIEKHAR